MDPSARAFLTTADASRARAYFQCYLAQTRHASAASQEHERCMGLQFGIQSRQFVEALRSTSMLAAREAALLDFARKRGFYSKRDECEDGQDVCEDGQDECDKGQDECDKGQEREARNEREEDPQGIQEKRKKQETQDIDALEQSALQLSMARYEMAERVAAQIQAQNEAQMEAQIGAQTAQSGAGATDDGSNYGFYDVGELYQQPHVEQLQLQQLQFQMSEQNSDSHKVGNDDWVHMNK
jgi:hypothetical protein